MLSDNLPYISGRHWYTIRHGRVRVSSLDDAQGLKIVPSVREILPELISQIVSLLAGDEADQQEVSILGP